MVLEEIGRNLTPSPFLTTAVAAVRALEGSAQAERWFPGIVAGETVAALAIDEGKHHDPGARSRWRRSGRAMASRSTGAKQFVVHGASADVILVAARTAGAAGERDGLTLFAVERDAAGLAVDNVALADSSKAARLTLRRGRGRCRCGGRRGRWRLGAACRARSTRGAPARRPSWSGSPSGAAAMTLDYLKQRKQFGKLIGEFQALQHRAAHLYGEIEIARAAALKAAQLLDAGDARAELMVVGRQGQGGARVARSRCRKACRCTAGSA